MSLYAEMMGLVPLAPSPSKARVVVAPEMQSGFRRNPIPRRDTSYGTVKPRVLAYLCDHGASEPNHIAEALNLHRDSVRRGMRALHKEKLIVRVKSSNNGTHASSVWVAACQTY